MGVSLSATDHVIEVISTSALREITVQTSLKALCNEFADCRVRPIERACDLGRPDVPYGIRRPMIPFFL